MASYLRTIQKRIMRRKGIEKIPNLKSATGNAGEFWYPRRPGQVAYIDGQPYHKGDTHPKWQPVLDILAGREPAAELPLAA